MSANQYLQVSTNKAQPSSSIMMSNEKLVSSYKFNKSFGDCCYSVANVALIIASIVALVFTIQFLVDDPLYEYGEHLLTRRFYYQLIFIIISLPLALLVPIFNAISAFLLTHRKRLEMGVSILTVKLIFQAIVALLIFLGLIFIAPSIRFSNVANQVAYELRKHMKRRYDNDFSFEFLDRIQEKYQCCDEPWYRANYLDKLPLSCFFPDGSFGNIYARNCADVLGSLISNRCAFVAVSLLAILISLIILLVVDVLELVGLSRERKYSVDDQETHRARRIPQGSFRRTPGLEVTGSNGLRLETSSPTNSSSRLLSHTDPKRLEVQEKVSGKDEPHIVKTSDTNEDNDEDDFGPSTQSGSQGNRGSAGRLLTSPVQPRGPSKQKSSRPAPLRASFDLDRELEQINDKIYRDNDEGEGGESDDDKDHPLATSYSGVIPPRPRHLGGRLAEAPAETSPLLTKASFVYAESQSPVLVTSPQAGPSIGQGRRSPERAATPTRGVLKKTSSFQRIDSSDSLGQRYDTGQAGALDHGQRDMPSRRSLMNVRFAE